MERLTYNDVDLVPNFSILKSRSRAIIGVCLGDKIFKSPVCPANMVCCINTELAKWLSENNYFYIMHRFDGNKNKKDLRFFVEKANRENWQTISVSVGVQKEDCDFLEWAAHNHKRIDYITIDLAHGHHILVKEMLNFLDGEFEKRPFVIAGNIATAHAAESLASWGANAIKVGIGGGLACTTRLHTGFHVPMVTSLLDIKKSVARIPIIADGGIRYNGDIAKAIALGAEMVMAGSIFAACKDSPAENVYSTNRVLNILFRWIKKSPKKKRYYGSASYYNGNKKNIEGTLVELPCNGMTYKEKLEEIHQDLSSSISYAGSINLQGIRRAAIIK